MTLPSKAIILAAGLGERMRPLSASIPKAMMPFAGKPILDHTVSSISAWGVKDILINLHHAPSPLVDYARNNPFPGVHLSFSFEPEIRGTGGALQQASWFIGDKPFWIINSDIVFELNPAVLAKEFAQAKALACLWVTSAAGPRTVDIDRGRVRSFKSATPGSAGTATFCGLHLVSPRIMPFVSHDTFSSIIPAYTSAMKAGKKIVAAEVKGSYWADIGSPEKLLACHNEVASLPRSKFRIAAELHKHVRESRKTLTAQGAKLSGLISAGKTAVVSRSVVLENCILGNGVEIAPHSSVSDCIVSDNVRARGKLKRAVVNFDSAFDLADRSALESSAWPGRGVVVEALPPRGSNRQLFRLHGSKMPAILIKYDRDARPENARFAEHLQFLSSLGLPVPSLLLDLPANSICIVEDLGDTSMQDAARSMPPHLQNELYRQVVRFTAMLHSKGTLLAKQRALPLEPPFDAKLYKWERDLFTEHYLTGTLGIDTGTAAQIDRELSAIPAAITEESVLIHRDLQSSNIMLKSGRPVFIDFQGMRMGSRYYDLASLLLDPYVSIETGARRMLIKEYSGFTGIEMEKAEKATYMAGIQRLAQALGAFGRLSGIEGMDHFAEYIPPALRMISCCLGHTDKLPVLAETISAQME